MAIVLIAIAAVNALAGSGSTAGHSSANGVPAIKHLVLIVGENTSASQITAAHAPYLTGSLKPQSAWFPNYHSFVKSSSLGNYIAMVSGQYTKCEANNELPAVCNQNIGNLFQQLDHAGRSWTDWQGSMDNACDTVDHGADWSLNVFSAHHNPAVYFTGIHGKGYDESVTPKAECRAHDLAMGTTSPNDVSAFDHSIATAGPSDFTLVVPNDCADGHDPCPTSKSDPVKQFDDFLAAEVPKITSSPTWDPARDVVAITWDEGADPPFKPGNPLLLMFGDPVKPGIYKARYDHYSLARTLEDAFGVGHLAHARGAHSILGVWK